MHITAAAMPIGFVRVRHGATPLGIPAIPNGALFWGIDDAIHLIGFNVLRWNERRGLFFAEDREWPGLQHQIRFYDEADLEISARLIHERMEALRRERTLVFRAAQVAARRRYDPGTFRSGPVPHTGRRGRWSHLFRIVATTAERRDGEAVRLDEDCVELGVRVRAKRRGYNLPDTRDDLERSDYHDRGWKSHRRTQWRAAR